MAPPAACAPRDPAHRERRQASFKAFRQSAVHRPVWQSTQVCERWPWAIVDGNEIDAYTVAVRLQDLSMSSITVRGIDTAIKEQLRVRAAQNGRSMEAEVRAIIGEAVSTPTRRHEVSLYDRIRAHVDPLGGVELELPPREPAREPPTFE